MRCGFIGAGNIGSAMIEGMLRSGKVSPSEITVRDIVSRDAVVNKFGVRGADSIAELVVASDAVFVAVKPKDCPYVFAELAPSIAGGSKIIVSVAAGVSLANIYGMLGGPAPVVRIMPNLNARIRESATAVCAGEYIDGGALDELIKILNTFGETFLIEEKQFGIFTALASCSPAFTYMYIDALARAAVKFGIEAKLARGVAARAVAGSARALGESPLHPYELVDMVCSPGGVTAEGVAELFENGFAASVMRAVSACVAKERLASGERRADE